jgi:heme/copper-type cytochrome/quinol oxidase subunit 2
VNDEGTERPSSERRTMPLGAVAATLAAVVLLALVAFASHTGERSLGRVTIPAPTHGNVVASTLTGLFIVAGLGAMVVYALGARRRRAGGRRRPLELLLSVVVITLLAGLVAIAVASIPRLGGDENVPLSERTAPPPAAASAPPADQGQLDWVVVAATAGTLFVALVLLAVAMRRNNVSRAPRDERPNMLLASLDQSLDDLRAEPDPRRAVIAAYARMERALAVEGLERRASEAPLEYLARMLADLRASAASSRRLTQLFERAKFSPHEIDPGMRDEAIDALEAVRTELRDVRAVGTEGAGA